ncbi:cobaltochelatase subunit CobN [Methylovulum psychrotolerans]|uniref:Cobaltochelatase subunit CobN n=1 Tax=Methylovulum psychrotolerans TaxID=1704499 RepID=A0A2S5CKZ3_9GAMM|nr:cobaltochelatase subunit CobN [Methylovulum psychrotolerans]POZ51468.1 cobaltochelatase subunit CobN [Methylovulum psychrotolerans]
MSKPLIALLSHAPSDLAVLHSALLQMPDRAVQAIAINLQTVADDAEMSALLADMLQPVRIIVLRVLGRLGNVPGFSELRRHAQRQGQQLLVISGTGEPDPELAAASTVAVDVLHQVQTYFQAGGSINMAQLLRYLSDHFLLTGLGFEPALALPEHGIYHPDLGQAAEIDEWLAIRDPARPSIGIVFYRAHWLSGNTRFIDALVTALEQQGLNVLPVFTASLRAGGDNGGQLPTALAYFSGAQGAHIDVLINTTAFAMGEISAGGPTPAGWSVAVLERLNVPVLQAITSGMTETQWRGSVRGLNPLDAAMNVVLPEFDGRIITVPLSFKAKTEGLPHESVEYRPVADRVTRIAGLAARFARLKRLPNTDKRVAFIFTNSNSKASQIGNAVGLDAPASLLHILAALQEAGYQIGELPDTGTALIHALIDRCAYDNTYLTSEQLANAIGQVSAGQYAEWFAELSESMQAKMTAQWGEPPGAAYLHNGQLALAGLPFGNALVMLQPPRGYGMDPDAIYHQPDLPPTHHYYALYRWLKDVWQADALVHVGKHGTLEWLPGKGVGLSGDCFPDALLADLPLFYPFIINDPGEGSQAKRRGHAVVVDHLTPPMTTADTYGALAQLTQLVDEYYQVEILDPAKLPLLQQQIWELVKATNLDADLQARLLHEHHDHDHEHPHGHHHPHTHPASKPLLSPSVAKVGGGLSPVMLKPLRMGQGVFKQQTVVAAHNHAHDPEQLPAVLKKMAGSDVAHLIEDLDGYLCELGAAQIRDGLHILGQAPEQGQQLDMLVALTRLPNQDIPGLQAEIARLFGFDSGELQEHPGRRLKGRCPALEALQGRALMTHADIMDSIDALSQQLFCNLQAKGFQETAIGDMVAATFANPSADLQAIRQIAGFVCRQLVPKLNQTRAEIDHLLAGLSGGYIPAGPSGSPTRGMAHILPTGRNFYSVDPRSVPSQSAWRVGQQLAHEVLARYQRETGAYPESVAISIWGTSAMRTHGDDVAQILALLGVRPVWRPENRQITGVAVIPLNELKRPRIDVTTRISGFFRDAFPQLIDLLDDAVHAVIALDEAPEDNFVRKHYLAELAGLVGSGLAAPEAAQRAAYRIFGAKPGSYGAGILPLIQEKNWQTDADFAESYINWGGYAYARGQQGHDGRAAFRTRLAGVQVALHNQDNREHDLFDSDDYLQFHGGMIATIRALTGQQPRHYFGDSHDPSRAQVRDLKEETLRVFRSRVVNPKWLASIQRHGYKGGLELTATVDYLFGYDATAHIMDDWMYEQVAATYALEPGLRDFLAAANPWAQNAIAERLLEAASRGMWANPEQTTLDALQALYLHSETLLEARGETPRLA